MDTTIDLGRRAAQALAAAGIALALAASGALGTATAQAGPYMGTSDAPSAESPHHGSGG